MLLKELIRQIKEQNHMTNNEIALALGVTKTTVGRWLSGEVLHLQEETTKRLSEWIGYDVDPVLNGTISRFKKPILGFVKAGYDLYGDENYLGDEDVCYDDYYKGDFFLRVKGDSMTGSGIMDGSLVYVKKTNHLKTGDIGVIMIENEEVTVKKVIFKPDMMILEASNPTVENKYYSKEEIERLPIKILGKVLYCKTEY